MLAKRHTTASKNSTIPTSTRPSFAHLTLTELGSASMVSTVLLLTRRPRSRWSSSTVLISIQTSICFTSRPCGVPTMRLITSETNASLRTTGKTSAASLSSTSIPETNAQTGDRGSSSINTRMDARMSTSASRATAGRSRSITPRTTSLTPASMESNVLSPTAPTITMRQTSASLSRSGSRSSPRQGLSLSPPTTTCHT